MTTKSKYVKDWTTRELKAMEKSLHKQIYLYKCYGLGDIRNLIAIQLELKNR